MPRKTQVTTVTKQEFEPGESVEQEQPSQQSSLQGFEDSQEAPDDVAAFLSRFGNNAKIAVYRIERTGEKSYLSACEPQYFSEEWLQETYGQGRYFLQARDGSNRIRGGRSLVIGPPPLQDKVEPETPPPPAAPVENNGDLRTQLLLQEMAMMRDLMIRIIEKPAPVMQQSSMGELVEAMSALKNIAAPPQSNNGNSMESIMSILKTGIEIGSTGTVSQEKGIMGIIKEALPVVGDALKAFIPARPAAPQANPAPAFPPAQMPAIEGMDRASQDMLMHGITYLKNKCLQGKDPATWINFIMDNMDDPQWQPWLRFAQLPYEALVRLDPELGDPPYRPWFEKLLSTVKDLISQPMEEPEQEPEEPDGISAD